MTAAVHLFEETICFYNVFFTRYFHVDCMLTVCWLMLTVCWLSLDFVLLSADWWHVVGYLLVAEKLEFLPVCIPVERQSIFTVSLLPVISLHFGPGLLINTFFRRENYLIGSICGFSLVSSTEQTVLSVCWLCVDCVLTAWWLCVDSGPSTRGLRHRHWPSWSDAWSRW